MDSFNELTDRNQNMKKKSYSRREFMTTLAAGAGTLILGKSAVHFSSPLTGRSPDPFQQVTLGKTGIKTTLIGMGTGYSGYNRSSNITRAGGNVAETIIRYAYEKGIRYFDCADSYGTHPYTRKALNAFPRESYVIGTKIWITPGGLPETERPDADKVVDRFRKELNTDYLDLVQLHCMTAPDWTDEYKRQMEILDTLKSRKIIRAHGVSVHSLEAMQAAANSSWVDVIHVRINPYGNTMDSRDPNMVVPVIEKMHQSGKGIIGMKLIGNGNFRNDPEKIDKSLKYVLKLGTVDMIIVGFELPEQVDDYALRTQKTLTELNMA
jgi:aryl-alcohol dehydrogenase-like predicted oxidoreductase